jgi:hypothetical protein
MKKVIPLLIVGIFFTCNALALDLKMLDIRQKIFVLSQEIKDNVPKTKDSYAMQAMFNSCLMTASQLDAYFHMVGVFDTIKKENLSTTAVDFLTAWLQQIQKTNQLNLNTFNTIISSVEPATKKYVERVRLTFSDLGGIIVEELNKVNALKKSIAVPLPPKTQNPKR